MTADQSRLEPNKEAMLLQLTHLFGETHADGMIELAWTDPQNNQALSKARLFDIADFSEIPDFAAARNAEGSNIYIGAALRKKGLPDHKRTSDDAFISLTAAYVDLDEPGVASKAREIYGAIGPTLVVITGQHPHFRAQLWWRLDDLEADPDKSRSLNKHLAVALSGDETVVNPSRVMRLGGSIAWPVKPGRVAEVTEVQLLGRPDVPAEALLNIVKHSPPQLPQTSATLPENTQTPVTHHSTLNLPDLNGLSVDGCIANISAGREWHRNMVKLTAHWVNAGMSDQEILLAAESLTLAGYTREETRIEVLKMLQGARDKWNIQNPSVLLEQPKLTPIQSLILKDWNGHKYAGEVPMKMIAPPPEPYWTEKIVMAFMEEAAEIHRCIPDVRVPGYHSMWPDTLKDDWERYYDMLHARRRRNYALPKQVDFMEEVMRWLRWLNVIEQRVIWARANNIPWKVLEHDFNSSKTTLWRHLNVGTNRLAAILNNNDPDGDYQNKLKRF